MKLTIAAALLNGYDRSQDEPQNGRPPMLQWSDDGCLATGTTKEAAAIIDAGDAELAAAIERCRERLAELVPAARLPEAMAAVADCVGSAVFVAGIAAGGWAAETKRWRGRAADDDDWPTIAAAVESAPYKKIQDRLRHAYQATGRAESFETFRRGYYRWKKRQ